MYARVLTGQIQPGKADEMIEAYRAYGPIWQQQKGFQGARQFIDRAASKLISITLWETQADLEASDGQYHEQVARFASLFTARPTREIYEVGAQVEPAREVGGD